MSNTFGREATASSTGKPTRTQLYCSNCRKNSEWKDIKNFGETIVSGVPSIQTQEVSRGRWAAHCPQCGMPYMAADKPMMIEGADLIRLEGGTNEAIREYVLKAQAEEAARTKKHDDYLRSIPQVKAPVIQ